MSTETPLEITTVILGAGFSGLGMACELIRHNDRDFIVLERAATVGGTWRANTYPGCACDIPSDLYSFSFRPNPQWSHNYAEQPEILDYLQSTALEYGLMQHRETSPEDLKPITEQPLATIRFNTELERAQWDEHAQRWLIQTSTGNIRARFLISGHGPLITPKWPEISGLESFEGIKFHSAQWRHDVDLSGKKVAVIGTGASAIQFIPPIQPNVAELTVFQRTPAWVTPRGYTETTEARRRWFSKVPLLQRLSREKIFRTLETRHLGFHNDRFNEAIQAVGKSQIRRHIKDPELREKLTPKYRPGCKRILVSDDFYPAMRQPNVNLITDPIVRVTPNAVVSKDAQGIETEHSVDVIIGGTGFEATKVAVADLLFNARGESMSQLWGESTEAYRGTMIQGFPNLFLLVGPNTALGHNSIVYIIEAQTQYVRRALKATRRRRAFALQPKPEVSDEYNRRIQEKLKGTVWLTGGCSSYYLNPDGINSTLWPERAALFRRELARFDEENYIFGGAASPLAEPLVTEGSFSA